MRVLWILVALALTGGCSHQSLTEQHALAAPLNSQRIQQQFGSYGIEVLRQDERLRVSNLYSTDAGRRTCRTLAIVRLVNPVPTELSAPHAEILAGGSIGVVLRRNGWEVEKRRLDLRQIDVAMGSRAATLMQLAGPAALATDIYELSAQRGAVSLKYAVIAEIHHPDYMTLARLLELRVPQSAHREVPNILRLTEQIATESIVGQ